MKKATLSQAFVFEGMVYGPGEVEVPDDLHKNPALAPAFRDALTGNVEATGGPEAKETGEPEAKETGKTANKK